MAFRITKWSMDIFQIIEGILNIKLVTTIKCYTLE